MRKKNKDISREYSQLSDAFIRKDLEQMERAENYIGYQFGFISGYLGRRVLEIGAGIGNITRKLYTETDLVVALEPNSFCFNRLNCSFKDKENLVLLNKRFDSSVTAEIIQYKVDTSICINVLEHIEDDSSFIKDIYDVLMPGGRLILIIPACEAAFGPIDRAIGHFRRYSKQRIQQTVSAQGFSIEKVRFFNPVGLIGWIFNAKFIKRVQQSDLQIKIFNDYVTPVQKVVEKFVYFPFGQSLLVICKKAQEK